MGTNDNKTETEESRQIACSLSFYAFFGNCPRLRPFAAVLRLVRGQL